MNAGDGSSKQKTGLVVLAVAGVFGSLMLVGFGGVAAVAAYWHWTTTPQYSLSQIKHAVDTHDVALFERHVDVDSVVGRFIDDIMVYSTPELQPDNGAEAMGSALAEGLVQLMKPKLVEIARDQVVRFVEDGSAGMASVKPRAGAGVTDMDLKKASKGLLAPGQIGTVAYVRAEGKIALVGMTIHNDDLDQDVVLELKLRDMDGYWRLVEVSNVPQLLAELDALRAKRVEEANMPIRQQIDAVASVESARKKSSRSRWSFSRTVGVEASVRNLSTRPISALAGTMTFTDAAGGKLHSAGVKAEVAIGPAEVDILRWDFDASPFDAEWTRVYEPADDAVRVTVDIRHVRFPDGTELKLFESFEEVPRVTRVTASR